jgi:hypothetical protein
MRSVVVLAVLVGWIGTACVGTSTRYAGYYDRTRHVYVNDALGFQLLFPGGWFVATAPQDFTVPLALRADQVQVLEAYDAVLSVGLVIVIQQGPLLDIDALVQRMQAVPADQVAQRLASPQATDVQQHMVRKTLVNGYEAAEWVYTATDATAGLPVEVTVSTYILKVSEHYVYLTFSVPTAAATASRAAIDAILYTFSRSAHTGLNIETLSPAATCLELDRKSLF